MSKRSPFEFELNGAEKPHLESMAQKYPSSCRDVFRTDVIYAAEGLSNDDIARPLDTPQQIVSEWRKRFYTECLAELEDRPGRERPGPFSPPVTSAFTPAIFPASAVLIW